jgi:coproporphyrinogen III oxidase
MNSARTHIETWLQDLQTRICTALEQTDGKIRFAQDLWQRPGGGGGRTRTAQNGNILEKAGVGFSAVHGESSEALLRQLNLTETADFYATGVSLVMHPHNPHVPIIHMNVRYFEMSNGIYWFGGGIDLTPHYILPEDARFFHQSLKNTCDRFSPDFYPKFKTWADDYFFIRHRQETRGIGGIFFDYLTPEKEPAFADKAAVWAFVQAVGDTFIPTYTHLMRKNAGLPFTEKEKTWQKLRRGRYAEFNLAIDRGTRFGLETDGRTESILMSLPPQAEWQYNHQPEPGSPEYFTLQHLKKGINWLEDVNPGKVV